MSQSSNHLRLVSWTWQWVHFTQMTSTVTRSQSNRAPLGCGGTRDSHHGCVDDKSAATVWCYHDNMDQNCFQHLVESMPRRIKSGLKANGVQPGTSKVYLIKWSVSVYYNIIFYLNYTHIYYGFESLIRDIEYWVSADTDYPILWDILRSNTCIFLVFDAQFKYIQVIKIIMNSLKDELAFWISLNYCVSLFIVKH